MYVWGHFTKMCSIYALAHVLPLQYVSIYLSRIIYTYAPFAEVLKVTLKGYRIRINVFMHYQLSSYIYVAMHECSYHFS